MEAKTGEGKGGASFAEAQRLNKKRRGGEDRRGKGL
jgi:hypothetical protein